MTRTTGRFLAAVCIVCAAAGARAQPRASDAITIGHAVSEAIDHNLSLLAERYNVTIASAAVITAGLRPNPVITVNAMLPQADLVDTGIATREGAVRTDYVIERGDKRDRRVEQATLAR